MLKLQEFVIDTLESIDALVEPLEYSLIHVVIPDDYNFLFHGKNELKLAFDFEVAQENDDSEFITFGSSILNNLVELSKDNALYTERYVIVENLTLSNYKMKIEKYLTEIYSQNVLSLQINNQSKNIGLWMLFTYNIEIFSGIQINEDIEIWFNLNTLEVDREMNDFKNHIFHEKEPIFEYPYVKKPDTIEAINLSFIEAQNIGNLISQKHFNQSELNRELSRINSYYDELEIENQKRLKRKGISEEKREEIILKNSALKLERTRQIKEMENKYILKPTIRLINGVLYHIPILTFSGTIKTRKSESNFNIYYNPVTKSFRNS
jgi:hypothetical protein